MKIYRIAKRQYIDDLSGEGARLYGGRWNKTGTAVVYFSEHLSLCVLELLVQADFKFLTSDYFYLEVTLPDGFEKQMTEPQNLPATWRNNPPISATQELGSLWIEENNGLVFKVPSAVLPQEHNYLINPNHPSFSKINFVKKEKLELDARVTDL